MANNYQIITFRMNKLIPFKTATHPWHRSAEIQETQKYKFECRVYYND